MRILFLWLVRDRKVSMTPPVCQVERNALRCQVEEQRVRPGLSPRRPRAPLLRGFFEKNLSCIFYSFFVLYALYCIYISDFNLIFFILFTLPYTFSTLIFGYHRGSPPDPGGGGWVHSGILPGLRKKSGFFLREPTSFDGGGQFSSLELTGRRPQPFFLTPIDLHQLPSSSRSGLPSQLGRPVTSPIYRTPERFSHCSFEPHGGVR